MKSLSDLAGTEAGGSGNATIDLANSILADPSSFYLNIHTAANPGGVARGQLTRVQ